MKLRIAIVLLLMASPALGEEMIPITLTCSAYAPANSFAPGTSAEVLECVNEHIPMDVPPDKALCITQMLLVAKFLSNPLFGADYDPYLKADQHPLYFMITGITVPSHTPNLLFVPPIRREGGSKIRFMFTNGMGVDQNIYMHLGGVLVDSNSHCPVF